MPIILPNLDDRTWKDLVEEGCSMIPAWAPEWTDRNPTDPGITLIELFAYFTEILFYRVNRISRENRTAFVRLLEGNNPDDARPLESQLQDALHRLYGAGLVNRAVTRRDYEQLAIQACAERAVEIGTAAERIL